MKPFEYTGYWWLPSSEENKAFGTVIFAENDRINLELNKLLEPDLRFPTDKPFKKYPIILGLTKNGLPVTLFDCYENERSTAIRTYQRSKHSCIAFSALIGAHFNDPQDIRFPKMDLHFSYLPQWAGVFPFRGYQKPFAEVIASITKGKITIQSSPRLSNEWFGESELPETVWIRIETPEALALNEWETQFIIPFQNFLSLATQRPNTLFALRAYIPPTPTTSEIPVQIAYPIPFLPLTPDKPVFPETSLFSLQDISEKLSGYLDAWLKITEELDSVCQLLFGVQYTKVYPSQRFLFLAQAAETYQGRRSNPHYLSEDEYQQLLSSILAGCPEEHQSWLFDRIEYGNIPPFRKKMKELVRGTGEILHPLIGNKSKERDAFAKRVFVTRNYYTHYDPELKQDAASGDDLYMITQYLFIAIQIHLLKELGFTLEGITEIFQKHELYQYLLGLTSYSE